MHTYRLLFYFNFIVRIRHLDILSVLRLCCGHLGWLSNFDFQIVQNAQSGLKCSFKMTRNRPLLMSDIFLKKYEGKILVSTSDICFNLELVCITINERNKNQSGKKKIFLVLEIMK